MPQKNSTTVAAACNDETTTRVTSARSFYRTAPVRDRIMLVPVNADILSEKESECCSRATD